MSNETTIPNHPEEDLIHHQPEWFRKALAEAGEDRFVTSEGSRVHYRFWPARQKNRPGLVFVHGNGAHARWFDFIAPLLTADYNVASMDLPGMGDSEWRTDYTRETYAHAIAAVAFDADLGPKPVIVGHSFGGFVTHITGGLYGHRLGGIMLCDFRVCPAERAMEWFLNDPPRRATRIYPDFETALGRFRLAPLQDCANRFILDYIGRHSLIEVKKGDNRGRGPAEESGWTWKFDPFAFEGLAMGSDHGNIYTTMPCKVAGIYGAESKDYDPETIAYMKEARPGTPVFTIPHAQHHIMLDQPLAFASAVHALMSTWEAEGALAATEAEKVCTAAE
ncbi:alpha/beta fold hydrolase [Tepidicaulis sp. LMO-SS28]|uniref:alpha/beta fold hydrolase n=1 Tax=Tepidicaulis sp. LMO-SS28 TaxID=3447455 RepID=UPI003EE066D8